MSIKFLAKVHALLLAGLVLSACGGGGGGGTDGGTAGPPPANVFNQVSVSLDRTEPIKQDLIEGADMKTVAFSILASGDVGSLNGKTVYVVVEDPNALFSSSPGVDLLSNPYRAYVNLFPSAKKKAPGTFKGNLKIHACLDQNCSTEMAGSPLTLPYDVTIIAGLGLDRDSIAVSVPFGEVPAEQRVKVTLPKYLEYWTAKDSSFYAGSEYPMTVTSTTDPFTATGVVSLALSPEPPGTYSRTVKVETFTAQAGDMFRSFEKTVTVTYTVTPNPSIDYVLMPAANVVRTQGDPTMSPAMGRRVLANTGVTVNERELQYLSHPAAADNHPQVEEWWFRLDNSASPCYNTLTTSNCLPVGTYTARVRYTITKDGVDRDVYWPITMRIVSR
jgi:hypothetical protein